jgi:hypothetical protein
MSAEGRSMAMQPRNVVAEQPPTPISEENICLTRAAPGDCYCFSTLNLKIAFVLSGPLKDHTLNLHSDDLLPLRSGAPVYGPNEG